MTREEALDDSYGYVHMEDIDDVQEFINKIYDEFESRTCENCRYSEYHECADVLECFNDSIDILQRCYKCEEDISLFEVNKDFGCNKWESK